MKLLAAPIPKPLNAPRVVIFLTEAAHESLPQAAHRAACLLPLGWTSLVDRVMQSCALAGLVDVDVVACDDVEDLRGALGHGERWGLKLNWHLAQDGHAPYGALRLLAAGAERVIIGHAHAWIDELALGELVREDCTAVLLEPALAWTGWASMPADVAAAVSPHADAQALAELMMAGRGWRIVPLLPRQHLRAGDAQRMLHNQARCLEAASLQAAPAIWIRMPWGLRSADAHIHDDVVISGPVVVGAGCLVESGVVIGPNTVLYGDVMVARGAVVEASLVLRNTYIGEHVTVRNVVVQGGSAHHVDWGVLLQLSDADAVLTPLLKEQRPSWTVAALWGRLIAALVLLLTSPGLMLAQLASRLQGGPVCWDLLPAVRGWRADGSLLMQAVRQPPSGADSLAARCLGIWGVVLDVLQGRRAWFGIRPRSAGDWYTLSREWQRLLARHPIGCFHAPAWAGEEGANLTEAQAVADVYFAARSGMRPDGRGTRRHTLRPALKLLGL